MKSKKTQRRYSVRYRINIPPDYGATIEKARKLGIRVRPGGGRPTRGGEPAEMGQLVLDLENIDCTVEINTRSGVVQFSYPSLPRLEKSVEILRQCYVAEHGQFDLQCDGPVDPLDRAFEFSTTVNWMGTGMTYSEAKTHLYQWLDPETGEYLFQLPDRENRVTQPGTRYVFQACVPIRIAAVDKDDEKGNRIVTAERLRWKMIKELKRIVDEHPRFKPPK